MSELTTTAANIIASLGIRGATATENKPGYMPVLGEDGKLSARFIPDDAVQRAFPPLSNVICVDPYTTVSVRNGSLAAPFVSLTEAAQKFSLTEGAWDEKAITFILMPGKYTDDMLIFAEGRRPLSLNLIGLGACTIAANPFVISNLETSVGLRTCVTLQNISTSGKITVSANADVTLLGKSRLGELAGADGTRLFLSSESRVDSTDIETIAYLTEDLCVGNTSEAHGATVRDALTRLHRRKLRLTQMTADSSGFAIVSSTPLDVAADSSGSDVFYDLRARDRLLVEGINRLFRSGKHNFTDSVTAQNIVADTIDVRELRMNAMALGGYKLTIDTYGYLVVMEGSIDPPRPPEHVFRLMDSVTGAIYILGVANGRLYLGEDDVDSSSDSSSSSSDVPKELTVYDPESGYTYSVTLESGRLLISRIGGES